MSQKLSQWTGFWPDEPMTKKKIAKMMSILFLHLFVMDLLEIYSLVRDGFKDNFLDKVLCAAEMMSIVSGTLKILVVIYYNKDLQPFLVKLKKVWKVCKFKEFVT